MTGLSTNGQPARLKTRPIKAIWPLVSPRLLLAMLIALAMLLAPLSVQGGSAMAMAPADHHGEMMDSGHCDEQPAGSGQDQSAGQSCCVTMCAAVAAASGHVVEPQPFAQSAGRPAPARFHHGFLAELPTPPPRLA